MGLQFRLDTLLLIVLLLSAVGFVIVNWPQPWVVISTERFQGGWSEGVDADTNSTSPNKLRHAVLDGMRWDRVRAGPIIIYRHDLNGNIGDVVAELGSTDIVACRFIDNDTVEGVDKNWTLTRWRRQFDESYIAHFRRPEVWIAILIAATLVLRLTVFKR